MRFDYYYQHLYARGIELICHLQLGGWATFTNIELL